MSYAGSGKYSHHTGREYRVLSLAKDMDTGKTCVIYIRESDSGGVLLWFSRSLESFNAQTFRRIDAQDSDGECLPKFQKTTELTMEDLRK